MISIARRLKAAGVLPWLDVWKLTPGRPWQLELERQIPTIGSAAVFVGGAGVGPWQAAGLEGFLDEFVQRGVSVIPVLLPDAAKVPPLARFLRRMVWVDFRVNDPDPFQQLLWGITERRPSDQQLLTPVFRFRSKRGKLLRSLSSRQKVAGRHEQP